MDEFLQAANQRMSRLELAQFLEALSLSVRTHPEDWANRSLEDFLSAWSNWLEDMDGFYENRNLPVPQEPSWQLIAQMMLAARVYE